MVTAPCRIQLRRTKGWRKPAGAVVVSRPSYWGNPFTLDCARLADGAMTDAAAREWVTLAHRAWLTDDAWAGRLGGLQRPRAWVLEHVGELAGKDLCCWCPLPAEGAEDHCHARVLMELANVAGGAR